jgi:hypothetical protein
VTVVLGEEEADFRRPDAYGDNQERMSAKIPRHDKIEHVDSSARGRRRKLVRGTVVERCRVTQSKSDIAFQ